MKSLLRALALTAVLVLSTFVMSHHANADTLGSCQVLCTNPTTHMFTAVTVTTTESQCCSESFNPCPAGYNPGARSFAPLGGPRRRCAA
jgi:hypothetical protein